MEEDEFATFSAAIQERLGLDLTSYQPVQMRRRVRGFLAQAEVERLSDLVDVLDRDPARLRQFRRFVPVTVSEFFRSPDRFAHLRDTILPALLRERGELRVWSAGCSYGAEACSVAMLLDQLAPGRKHCILATDIDDTMLERAASGEGFSPRDIRHMPSAIRGRYLEPSQRAVRADILQRVTFRRHNLLDGAPEGDFDLILCRNVLMYFNAAAKARIVSSLYDALRMGGVLFTASGEALPQLGEAGFVPLAVGFHRKEVIDARR